MLQPANRLALCGGGVKGAFGPHRTASKNGCQFGLSLYRLMPSDATSDFVFILCFCVGHVSSSAHRFLSLLVLSLDRFSRVLKTVPLAAFLLLLVLGSQTTDRSCSIGCSQLYLQQQPDHLVVKLLRLLPESLFPPIRE